MNTPNLFKCSVCNNRVDVKKKKGLVPVCNDCVKITAEDTRELIRICLAWDDIAEKEPRYGFESLFYAHSGLFIGKLFDKNVFVVNEWAGKEGEFKAKNAVCLGDN